MIIPDRQSALSEWIDWLLHLHAEEIDLGLDRIRQVAESMDLLKPAPFVISVAGTNGKGSSVAMLVAILRAAGYRTGAYTSPHIQQFNERIQIDGQPVSDSLIVDAFTKIESSRKQTKLTYFEFSTLAALEVFKNAQLDVVVLEVGLGGRLDAVNVVDADAALITAIDIDHIDWLGDDRSVIATEKAGITRADKPAVCSDPKPPESLQQYAIDHCVPLIQFKADFDIRQSEQGWSLVWMDEGLKSKAPYALQNLPEPGLKGAFQLQNSIGVIALLSLVSEQLKVDDEAIIQGLKQVRHPGRLETFKLNSQDWLVDVAHNPQSAQALADYLAKQSTETESVKYQAVFSVLSDKDVEPMVRELAPYIQSWFIADLAIPRSTSVEMLQKVLLQAGVEARDIYVQSSITEAVEKVLQQSNHKVLTWGSFFTVAQVYDALDLMGESESKKHG